ncbi:MULTISPECIES: hypothetical protein [Enterobacter]|uniref:hypothetical protein n=1 Tax=Enterobacter TaxID=547 RepID=UPI0013D456E2|nr:MULTISPECIES: hypothetical protein [Enterobacter]NEV85072.1 hypothetical protein [Enterobacter asburiae]NMD68627.1 hypothetical protein [Enterobacter sp. DNRA5]
MHILLGAPHAEYTKEKAAVIFDLRLPRILAAVMVGAPLPATDKINEASFIRAFKSRTRQ